MTLVFPEWIRNEHEPAPLTQQVGLFIKARDGSGVVGQPLSWKRDPLDPYLYHLTVPNGVRSIEVRFDFITADKNGDAHGSSDANLAVLDWNTVVLYPYSGPAHASRRSHRHPDDHIAKRLAHGYVAQDCGGRDGAD